MLIKIVNGNQESLIKCDHINTTTLDGTEDPEIMKDLCIPEGPGKFVRLFPDGPNFMLPKDGQVVYVMDDATGDTIQTIRPLHQEGAK